MTRGTSKLPLDTDDAFASFFEKLGYCVQQEGKKATGQRWYEISDKEGLAFQISMPPPPIAELIADLPSFIEGKPGIGPTDYWCAVEDDDKLRALLALVEAAR